MTLTRRVSILLTTILVLLGLPLAAAASAQPTPDLCVKSQVHATFDEATLTFTASDRHGPCTVRVSVYRAPDTWDGGGFDVSAAPQSLIYSQEVVLTSEPTTTTVTVQDSCGVIQADLTVAAEQDVVTFPEGSTGFVVGGLVRLSDTCESPSPSPTPSDTPSVSPTPSVTPSATMTGKPPTASIPSTPTPSVGSSQTASLVPAAKQGPSLAKTGAPIGWLLAVISILVIVGVLFVGLARKPRGH